MDRLRYPIQNHQPTEAQQNTEPSICQCPECVAEYNRQCVQCHPSCNSGHRPRQRVAGENNSFDRYYESNRIPQRITNHHTPYSTQSENTPFAHHRPPDLGYESHGNSKKSKREVSFKKRNNHSPVVKETEKHQKSDSCTTSNTSKETLGTNRVQSNIVNQAVSNNPSSTLESSYDVPPFFNNLSSYEEHQLRIFPDRVSVNFDSGALEADCGQPINPTSPRISSGDRQQVESDDNCSCDKCRQNRDPEETLRLYTVDTRPLVCDYLPERQSPIGSADADQILENLPGHQFNGDVTGNEETGVKSSASPGVTNTQQKTTDRSRCKSTGEVQILTKARSTPKTDRYSWHDDLNDKKGQQSLANGKKALSDSKIISQLTYHNLSKMRSDSKDSFSDLSVDSENQVYKNNLDDDDAENDGDDEQARPARGRLNINHSNSSNGSKEQPGAIRIVPTPKGHRIKVFITFSWNPLTDTQVLFTEMIELVQHLKKYHIKVRLDREAESIQSIMANTHDWMEEQIQQVRKHSQLSNKWSMEIVNKKKVNQK